MPNEKKHQSGRTVEKWLSAVFLAANVAALLLCHLITTAFVEPGVPNAWRDYGTPLLITVLAGQVIIHVIKIREHTTLLTENVKCEEMFVFPPMTVTSEALGMISKSASIHSVKIICYGTGLLGGVITALYNAPRIEASVVVCSPDIDILGRCGDQTALQMRINEMDRRENITIHKSPVPPTIRAIVMYDDRENPIWCSVQPYYFYVEEEDTLLRGEGYSPAVIIRDKNSHLMSSFDEQINNEFKRLKELSEQYAAINPAPAAVREAGGTAQEEQLAGGARKGG